MTEMERERRLARKYRRYKRRAMLHYMFKNFKSDMRMFEYGNAEFILLWLKALICLLLAWERHFDYRDNDVVICTGDESESYEGVEWLACNVHRSPLVWGVEVYLDWN